MRLLAHPAEEDLQLETIFYALTDPARMQIVRTLLRLDAEQSCSMLGERMPRSTLSHHLKVLREAGITRTRLAGTHRYVTIRRDELERRFPGLLALILISEGTPSPTR